MNERIRELIEECTDRHFCVCGGFETFDKGKFAELIVKECAQVCIGKYAKSDYMSRQAGIDFGKDIKQHFGVEE